mgnify:CR=1 FL=1
MSPTLTYMATIVPGLESVATSEICTKLPGAWVQTQLRGRILFNTDSPREDLLELRCVDNLYLHIAWLKIGPHKAHLANLTTDIENTAIDHIPYLATANPGSKAIVSASRAGHHTFSRFEAADAVLKGLSKAHKFVPGTIDAHDLDFRLDIIETDALFSLKLTDATFRFRGMRTFSRAALRPSMAHALIWISEPKPCDVFLDPFCGSGTIPIERADYEALSITGVDISAEAVMAAKDNAPNNVNIQQMDACNLLDIPAHSVTTIVTNLPWGKQIAPTQDIGSLYSQFLQEAKRVLAPRGKAILLTDQEDAISEACRMNELQYQPLCTVSLHGSLPIIYLVTHRLQTQ